MYTSGTTGEPKGVVLTNQAIVAEVLSVDQMFVVTGKVVRDQTLVLSLNLNAWMWLWFSYFSPAFFMPELGSIFLSIEVKTMSVLSYMVWRRNAIMLNLWSSLLQCSEEDTYFSFLPLAHIYDQIIETHCIHKGCSIGFWRGVRTNSISQCDFFSFLDWGHLHYISCWLLLAGCPVFDGGHPGTETNNVFWGP